MGTTYELVNIKDELRLPLPGGIYETDYNEGALYVDGRCVAIGFNIRTNPEIEFKTYTAAQDVLDTCPEPGYFPELFAEYPPGSLTESKAARAQAQTEDDAIRALIDSLLGGVTEVEAVAAGVES